MKNMINILIAAAACWMLIPGSVLMGQKPKVAIVVWDGHCKEGQNVGTFRVYQLGDPVPGLKVRLKCEGSAGEGLDYRSLGLGIIQEVDRYNEIHIRPIDDGLLEGTEEARIRILESEDYVIDEQYSQASIQILDAAFPDVEFEMPSSINMEANELVDVTVILSETFTEDIELTYTVQGVLADEGEDFQFESKKLIIPAGNDEGFISFQVKDDLVPEDDGTVVIRLVSAENANIATLESHYYTIQNDDGEPHRSVVYDRIYGTLLGFRAG